MYLSLPPFWSSWLAWPKPPPSQALPSLSLDLFSSLPRRTTRRLPQPAELRIDVEQPSATIEQELDALYLRLHTPGDALHGLSATPLPGHPGLRMRSREADGELYVYIEDPVRECLAGFTVFNRLIELNRRADRYLRAPHSKYALAYQRRGLATAIYRWALEGGQCLVSGARQSVGAHALWQRLGREYLHGYVGLQDKTLTYLGAEVEDGVREALPTRRLLLGWGWTLERLAEATGMRLVAERS